MNKKEAAKIISILQINYPDSFRNKTDDMVMATISLWAKMFEADSPEDVTAAVMAHMAADTSRFMPPVGVIKNRLATLQAPYELTAQEAWGLVDKALRNGYYNAEAEFNALPPTIQRLVGSYNQLREWAMMEAETVQSVVASNFQKSYKARMTYEKEYQMLPTGVKKEIERMSQAFQLPEQNLLGEIGEE